MKQLPWSLLPDLKCPCCGAQLGLALNVASSNDGLQHGTLRCACYEYPVVEGIAVLRQMSPVSSTHNEAVTRLHAKDPRGALEWLLSAGSAAGVAGSGKSHRTHAWPLIGRLRHLFVSNARLPQERVISEVSEVQQFEAALITSRPRGYADYLYQRLANPSFLGAISPLVVLGDVCRKMPRCRVLDLLSGVGHASFTVQALCPGLEVVMADADYVNLFLARRFVALDTVAICMDVDLPLPFSDESFDGLFCLDGLHYVRAKVTLLQEVNRIISAHGIWVFAHMHNASGSNVNPGAPLTADEYARQFAFGQQRLLPENAVLNQFRNDGVLDLTQQPGPEALSCSDALTLIGARSDALWRRHASLDEAMFRRPDLLALNPLYRDDHVQDGLHGTIAWPSEVLQSECSGKVRIFEDRVHISARTLDELVDATAEGTLSDELRKLIRSFVFVSLPPCYPRSGILRQTQQRTEIRGTAR